MELTQQEKEILIQVIDQTSVRLIDAPLLLAIKEKLKSLDE